MTDFLLLSFIFLFAGVLAVPVASRLGLGTVLGYLFAGIAISPLLLFFKVDVVAIQHFAEFGVVMMLFLVGLELEPKTLWAMRTRLFGLGGLQLLGTVLLVMLIVMLFNLPWTTALAIGLVLALSSTAIVLQTLNEKGMMKSDAGKSSFAVLLFQDIAVIPMLAFIPVLASPELVEIGLSSGEALGNNDHAVNLDLTEGLNGWQTALLTLSAVILVVMGGHFLTRPVFGFIAVTRLRELFTATALLFVIGIALLMSLVGLSPALGAFMGGVVLADSEYRHELKSAIDPFHGLLLSLFFMTVGAGINFELLWENFGNIIGMTLGLMTLKCVVLYSLAIQFKLRGSNRWYFALGLSQAGEFGFVLLSFTVANHVIPTEIVDQLFLVVALSMLFTPGLFVFYERVILSRLTQETLKETDTVDSEGDVIIAGHGRFGGVVNHMLLSAGYKTTVLDYSASQLEILRSFGIRVFYGDASRPDLLNAAGIHKAKILVIAINHRSLSLEIVRHVHQNHPNVHIVARALDRRHVYDLYAAGCRDIIRDTFDSAVRTARSTYEALGVHPLEAEKFANRFVKNDKKNLAELASLHDPEIPAHENTPYRERVKELIAEQKAEFEGKDLPFHSETEQDLHSDVLKNENT